MARHIDFKLDEKDYIELGRRALEKDETEKAVGYFKTACRLSDSCEAYTELGYAYAKIRALELSNAVLYKAMFRAYDEEEENAVLWQLCSNALEDGEVEVASYYLRYLGEDDSALMKAAENKTAAKFKIATKPEREFCETQLYLANEAIAENDIDATMRYIAPLENAPEPYRSTAQKIKTLCLFAKGDFDRVVAISEEMVRNDPTPDNKATLATAYSVQERNEEAGALLDEIMRADDLPMETALKVMPMLIAANRDADILRIAKIMERAPHLGQYAEMYRSQATYNLGDKKEAMRIACRLNNIYGKYSAAWYYIALYRTEPARVDYGHELPQQARLDAVRKVKTVLDAGDAGKLRTALAEDEEFNDALEWVMYSAPDFIACPTLVSLSGLRSHKIEKLFLDRLIAPDLSFDAMMIMLDYLLGGGLRMEIDVVAQDRYKQVDFRLPGAFYSLPGQLRFAVYHAACDILYTDEDPTTYLERLAEIVDGIAVTDGDGKLFWTAKEGRRIGRLKNRSAMVAVLLSEVYRDDPDPDEDAMSRYDVDRRTFYKYKKLFFGDGDEN